MENQHCFSNDKESESKPWKSFLHGKNIKNLKLNEFARKVSIVHQYNQAADDITVERLISYGRTPYMKLMGGKSEEDEN